MAKLVKAISQRGDYALEAALNEFFKDGDTRWRLVCVTRDSSYLTAWLEFEDIELE